MQGLRYGPNSGIACASCETDLMDQYGLRRACAWIGNSAAIAMRNYALMKKTDYLDVGDAALRISADKSDAKSDAVGSRNDSLGVVSTPENPTNQIVYACSMGGEGLEPPTLSV